MALNEVKEVATQNFEDATLDEFIGDIKEAIELGEYNVPYLGFGKSGIGKTESIRNAICDPLGIGLIEMRLGSYSAQDLTGFPVPLEDDKVNNNRPMVYFSDVSKFPHEGRDPERGILLLDEFPAAEQDVRTAALQLTDVSRSIGDYHLPPKWLVVILGNGPDDGGAYLGCEYTLLNRCMCYRVHTSFDIWKNWALRNNVNDAVLAFIENNGADDMLHNMNPDSEYYESDASPRMWYALSQKLNAREALNNSVIDPRKAGRLAGAAVGHRIAPKFEAFYAFKKDMIPVADIMSGKAEKTDVKNRRIESLYILINSISSTVNSILITNHEYLENREPLPKEEHDKLNNLFKFVIKLGRERQIDLAIGAFSNMQKASSGKFTKLISLPTFSADYPEYLKFALEHRDMLITNSDIERYMSSN